MNIAVERLAYTVKSFAKAAELSESFVKREIYDGNLKAIKRRGRVIVPAEAARAYLAGEQQNETRIQTETLASQV